VAFGKDANFIQVDPKYFGSADSLAMVLNIEKEQFLGPYGLKRDC